MDGLLSDVAASLDRYMADGNIRFKSLVTDLYDGTKLAEFARFPPGELVARLRDLFQQQGAPWLVRAAATVGIGVPDDVPADAVMLADTIIAFILFIHGMDILADPQLDARVKHAVTKSMKGLEASVTEWRKAPTASKDECHFDWEHWTYTFSDNGIAQQWATARNNITTTQLLVSQAYKEIRKLFPWYKGTVAYVPLRANQGVRLKDDGWKWQMEKKLTEVLNNFMYFMETNPLPDDVTKQFQDNLLLLHLLRDDLTWKRMESGGGRFAKLQRYTEGAPLYSTEQIKALESEKRTRKAGFGGGGFGGSGGASNATGSNFRGFSSNFRGSNRGRGSSFPRSRGTYSGRQENRNFSGSGGRQGGRRGGRKE